LTLESSKEGFKLIQCLKGDLGQLAKIKLFFHLESHGARPRTSLLPFLLSFLLTQLPWPDSQQSQGALKGLVWGQVGITEGCAGLDSVPCDPIAPICLFYN
jgi:hypothetical protein